MKTKTKSRTVPFVGAKKHDVNPNTGIASDTQQIPIDLRQTITYELGPRFHDGKSVWKYCYQKDNWHVSQSDFYFISSVYRKKGYINWLREEMPGVDWSQSSLTPLGYQPSDADWAELRHQFDDQVDLNTGESVLIYTGVLQAIPLIGGLVKANSIINRIGRWATKALRRRPFTEVIRAAISADFISRFVIQPTIDDLHKVADSMNYVLNKLQTLNERNNAATTAFQQETTVYGSSQTVRNKRITLQGCNGCSNGSARIKITDYQYRSVKTWLLAKVMYEESQVSPIKLWLKRTGISTPLESIWDGIPFSFVADWFVRSGDFLTACSQELASDEGLKGTVAKIHDCWITSRAGIRRIGEYSSIVLPEVYSGYTMRACYPPGKFVLDSGDFVRYRADSDKFTRLGVWSDRGLISPQLTSTRTRTLAELLIQAKLR